MGQLSLFTKLTGENTCVLTFRKHGHPDDPCIWMECGDKETFFLEEFVWQKFKAESGQKFRIVIERV